MAAALIDVLAVVITVAVTSVAYHAMVFGASAPGDKTLELAIIIAALFFFVNLLQRRYRLTRYLSHKGQIPASLSVWSETIIAFVVIGFLAQISDNYARAVVVLSYVAGIPMIALARWWLVKLVSVAARTGRVSAQRMLLIGSEADVAAFLSVHRPWNEGLLVEEMLTFRVQETDADPDQQLAMIDADLAAAVQRAREISPDGVMICLPWSERALIERCIEAFLNLPVAINLAPDHVLERFDNPRIVRIGSIPSLELAPAPLTSFQILTKRLFDILGASVLLLLLMPLFAAIAVAIRTDSAGPVLFLQRRYGFNQVPFRIWKFRTMTCMDDGDVVRQASRNDPRITRTGAWLRRYNLDELPQLVNVLLGHMSLVGPRPHALAHDREFERKIGHYARRHNVRPGITGWAQVHGLRGETDTDDKMSRRVSHDLWYIDNWNIWLDIAILIRTVISPKAYRNAG